MEKGCYTNGAKLPLWQDEDSQDGQPGGVLVSNVLW